MADRKSEQKLDLFAQIAAVERAVRDESLVESKPPDLPDMSLPDMQPGLEWGFELLPKLDSPAKLRRELSRMRKLHRPFLRNLSPPPPETRTSIALTQFDWRLQTEADTADFRSTLEGAGEWEQVSIPHYGGPIERATAYYRTTLNLTDDMFSLGALFVCFKGVDYKAHVFMNGAYLGSHEGFFAPFEFDFTQVARKGENILVVKVENDAVCLGNDWGPDSGKYEGDKIYAATGPGYDEPEIGWHHCPPGMGIYQDVYVESRAPVHIHDVFVRPMPEGSRAEAWIEVYNCHTTGREVGLRLSVYGQNFRSTVFRNRRFDLTGEAGPGVNYYRLSFEIPDVRLWDTEHPWLYQIQVSLLDDKDSLLDSRSRQFGMRSFRIDEDGKPKGRLYLNCREIRLRGANTMGFEQQDVMKKEWDQLIDDILLAKICNMNFLRITQRPVQEEVYEYCDRLGLMTQTDLPLFGVLRRNQFVEAVRQAQEMERLVRSHPCNIMNSYINEPLPNGNGKPHRHLTRPELEDFFTAASLAVRVANPDRITKPVDGDYDPPAEGLPDNHCYCGWYNGHGVDLGKLHKGYWQKVKPGWMYACGEFGAEGLDPVDVMRKYYPAGWLPQSKEEEKDWTPSRITMAQTGRFHYMWFDTQHSLMDWTTASRQHQAWIIRLMAEAFRRDSSMVSFAIHLFIDAFPSGWMKTIMDVDRQPKPAYFAYREALTPLMANLRSDRRTFFSGEEVSLEAWVCNDLNDAPQSPRLRYQLEMAGEVISCGQTGANTPECSSAFQGFIRFLAPEVSSRSKAIMRLGLLDSDGRMLHDTSLDMDVFPQLPDMPAMDVCVAGREDGPSARLCRELGISPSFDGPLAGKQVILIDNIDIFTSRRSEVIEAVRGGALAVFHSLPEGKHKIANDTIEIEPCGMGAVHFVSRKTGHPMVSDLKPHDFKFWYDANAGYITPILGTTFTAPGWRPILASGNGGWSGEWRPALAAAERKLGKGTLRICQLDLANRIRHNPVALLFAERLMSDTPRRI